MFLKNITQKDIVLNFVGNGITLKPEVPTYVPDELALQSPNVINMYSKETVVVTDTTGLAKEYKLATETEMVLGHLYLVQGLTELAPSLYIEGGTVNVHGSCSQTLPNTLGEMDLPSANLDVSGYNTFEKNSVPKYIAVSGLDGAKVIATNLRLLDLGNIG